MRFINNDKVPVRVLDRIPDLGVPFERIDGDNRSVKLIEHIVMGRDPISHPPDCGAVEPGERDRKPGPELLLKLGQHGPRRDHKDPVRPATQGEFGGDQARL